MAYAEAVCSRLPRWISKLPKGTRRIDSMKKSIEKKISSLLAGSLIILGFFMIGVNLALIINNTNSTSGIMMSKGCENQAAALNKQIELVEQAVWDIYDISEKIRPGLDELKDRAIEEQYTRQILDTAITIADNTNGALAVYYRLNPDITLSGTSGFFYIRNAENKQFEATEITDLYQYDPNDVEHVGWYYTPVWAGKAVWMDPYFNANLGVDIISYVIPVYDGPTLVGVVGMDVSFDMLIETAEAINIYKSCGAVLGSMNNSRFYFNRCDLWGDSIPNDIYSVFQGSDYAEAVFTRTVNDEKYCLYFVTLENRMKFLVYANRNEVYAQAASSIVISGLIFFAVFSVTLILALKVGKKIVTPIRNITDATKKYADGEWDAQVTCDTEDELQLLTENITIMARKTKGYIEYIEDLAKKDGLTGLRNKAAYLMYEDMINAEYVPNKHAYALIVFDVNNLKSVNDNYGHEKGDELILSASKIICRYFAHSPIFRIGGDEFVAILDGGDYENRHEIVADFQRQMELSRNSEDVMNVCIACGIADSVEGMKNEALFASADQKMYENKLYLKGGILPR